MKIFVPFLLLLLAVVLPAIYFPVVRQEIRRHLLKIVLGIAVTAVVLFVLFAAMSVSTWRLF